MRSQRNGVLNLAELTTTVARKLDMELDDLIRSTKDFVCGCCSRVNRSTANEILRRIASASGVDCYPSVESEPLRDIDEVVDRVIHMIQMLAGSLTVGNEFDRSEAAVNYVLCCFHDLIHDSDDEIGGFARYNRLWSGYRYQRELVLASPERFAAIVEHLTRLCQDVPDAEPMPACYFPRTEFQREIYIGRGSEAVGVSPLTPVELKDLRVRLVARHKLDRVTLLTDEQFLVVVAEVRVETCHRLAIGEAIKQLLIGFCNRNFGLNLDQPLPVMIYDTMPDMSQLRDVRIEVGESDRVPGGFIIRIIPAVVDDADPSQHVPFGIMQIML